MQGTLTVNVGANNPPTGVVDSNSVTESGTGAANAAIPGTPSATGNVLANDTDPDALDTKTVSLVNGTAGNVGSTITTTYGTINIAANGSYTYTLDNSRAATQALTQGQVATEVISYRVRDTAGLFSDTSLTVTVNGSNDVPVAVADTASTPLNVPLLNINVKANDTDVDNTPAQLTVSNPTLAVPANGTVTLNADGTINFTPASGITGPVVINYTLTDATGAFVQGTLTVTVTTLPTFSINDVTVNEGAGTITFTVTKSGATALTTTVNYAVAPNTAVTPGDYTAGTSPLTGTLSFASGVTTQTIVLNITNDAVFEPTERFNVNLSAPTNAAIADNLGVGTITDNDAAPNTPPVANGNVFSTNEDAGLSLSPAALLGNDTDADGDPLTILSVQSAANGTVALIGGNIVFTPASNYSGPASFTYTISDGRGGTSTATVSVNVVPVNDSPVANGDSIGTTLEDTPLLISASSLLGNDTDPDGDLLTVVSVQSGVGGTVSLVGGVITFAPSPNFNGPASFTYTISDGNGGFSTATVTVNVTAVNDAPVASSDSVTTNEDQPLTLTSATLLGNDVDVDGDPLTITSVQNPVNGTVALVNGAVVFTPVPNYNGPASFTYTIADGQGAASTATVNITVVSVNDVPVAADDTAADTLEDFPLTIPVAELLADDTDIDGDKLAVTSVQGAINGTVQLVDGNVVFTPTPGYDGPASFTYTVSDGQGGTSTARVDLKVIGVNNPPVSDTNVSLTEELRPNVPGFTTVAEPALHVLFSLSEANSPIELRGDRGVFQTDGATSAELAGGLRTDLTFAEGNQFGSRGLGGTRNNDKPRDSNALYVQQAVRYQSLRVEPGLFVHEAVRSSQFEAMARSIRIDSFNSAVPGVMTLLDGFAFGSAVPLTEAQRISEASPAGRTRVAVAQDGLGEADVARLARASVATEALPVTASLDARAPASRGADSFATQLRRNAMGFKPRMMPVASRSEAFVQPRV